jgi:hypothetical protein
MYVTEAGGGGSDLFVSQFIYNATSAAAANVFISSGGQLVRSTASSLRYKRDVERLVDSLMVHAVGFNYIPGYVTDDPDGNIRHLGFIAEEVYEALGPDSVIYDADGLVEDYIDRHVLASVEARLAAVEAAVFADSDGLLHINTSTLRYKTNVKPAPEIADIQLVPISFTKNGVPDLSFAAEWLTEQDTRLGVWDEDGEVLDFRDRAVLAVLAAKINRLEELCPLN